MDNNGLRSIPDLKVLLLDLDDTLLINPMSKFIPVYFELISGFARDLVSPEKLTALILQGVKAMEKNTDKEKTNAAVFYESMFSGGEDQPQLKKRLERFYVEEYPKLARLTQPNPDARDLVERAFQSGLQVVIATNPLFPEIALEQRIEWAGVPVSKYPYTLVTSFENMHASKPNPEYFQEILIKINHPPEACLMVGDDWERDIVPATNTGIPVFWVTEAQTPTPENHIPLKLWLGQGSLKDLKGILWEKEKGSGD